MLKTSEAKGKAEGELEALLDQVRGETEALRAVIEEKQAAIAPVKEQVTPTH